MKKVLLAGAALVAISSIPAVAADLGARPAPVYKAAPAVVAPYNWSGFYVGGQVGYQWNANDQSVSAFAPGGAFFDGPFGFSARGVVGGGHVGYNWQFGQWVAGIEGDFEGSGVKGDVTIPATSPVGPGAFSVDQKWQASLRGRLGWTWDRVMIYGTGGIAWGNFDATATNLAAVLSESWSDTLTGWTLGAGVEWALWQNWTGRVEYRYTDYKSFTGVSSVVAPGGSFGTDDLKFHTVRAGLSYRFGDWGKGPMVARY